MITLLLVAEAWRGTGRKAVLRRGIPLPAYLGDWQSVRLQPAREQQNQDDNQDNTKDAHAAVTHSIAIATESSAKSAKQGNDEDDDQNETE